MERNNIAIAILVLLVILLSIKTWQDSDNDDKESRDSYKQQVLDQQAIMEENNKEIRWLKNQNNKLDLRNDSLIELGHESIERVKIIYRDNEKTHNDIDTADANTVSKYWARELPRYFEHLTERASKNEDE
jgi:Tfp pilus assembly protein PilV